MSANGPQGMGSNPYDIVGRRTRMTWPDGLLYVDYDYDTAGNATPIRENDATSGRADRPVINAELDRTTYQYDDHDRLARTSYPVPTKGANASSAIDYEGLSYDAALNVTQRGLRDGQLIGYGYDNRSRLVSKNLPGAEPDAVYAYDLLGRLTTATQNDMVNGFAFNALGPLTAASGVEDTVSYQSDAAGRCMRMTWPDGLRYVDYDYDPAGNVTAIRENGAASEVGVVASYAYDALGRRLSVTYGNGTSQSFAYDAAQRLSALTNDLIGVAQDLVQTFAYNPAGQITQETQGNDAYAWTGHYTVDRTYTANGLNQLTNAGGVTRGAAC